MLSIRYKNLSAFATVGCGVFLQAGNGHCHLVRQATFLVPRQLAQPNEITHAITGCEVLVFEPSMLWTANRIGRRGAHEAPVENAVGEVST